MADRVSASIVLGGTIDATVFAKLAALIQQEDLSTEWGGEPFQPADHRPGEPLSLYAHEVAWGRFEGLEEWCTANGVPFARWSADPTPERDAAVNFSNALSGGVQSLHLMARG